MAKAVPVPTTTLPFPLTVNLVAGVTSAVPEPPAVAVWKNMSELPEPVEMPEDKFSVPPFKLVPPEIAPPAWIVKLRPAVAAVSSLSIQKVCAASPDKDKIYVGPVVPMPTLPVLSITNGVVSPSLVSATKKELPEPSFITSNEASGLASGPITTLPELSINNLSEPPVPKWILSAE